ncbi:ISAs1 family transposase [Aliivibrio fischeri]|uniref:ISAs1 family transposase n=1 Tax=Aliivibrio fischeri TaxID=668 RepID=UPI0011461DBB
MVDLKLVNTEKIVSEFPDWPKLKTFGVAVSYRATKYGRDSIQYCHYISSANLNSEKFAIAVRSHWGIENKLDWVLDIAMNEDDCQIYRDSVADNLACTRHIGLNMSKIHINRNIADSLILILFIFMYFEVSFF